MFQKLSNSLSIISGLLAIVVTAVTLGINTKTAKLQEDVTHLNLLAKQQEVVQKDVQFGRDFKFKMYDEVAASIESNNPRKQRAAVALISALLSDSAGVDVEYRNALLNVFLNSDSVNKILKEKIGANLEYEQKFKQEQQLTDSLTETRKSVANTSIPKGQKWDVDIFYNENTLPQSLVHAEMVKSILKDEYHARVRILSSLTNAKPGYGVLGNEIRYNDNPGETEQANKIKNMLSAKNYSCSLKVSGMDTPWYLSVFIQ